MSPESVWGGCRAGELVRAPGQREFRAERGRAQTLPAAWWVFFPSSGGELAAVARRMPCASRQREREREQYRDPRGRELALERAKDGWGGPSESWELFRGEGVLGVGTGGAGH